MTAPDDALVKDMATSWDEFVRLMPVALRGWTYDINGSEVAAGTPERGVRITVSPLPPRRFGLVQIERSQVSIAFRGLETAEREDFLRQFDRAFQRGGG